MLEVMVSRFILLPMLVWMCASAWASVVAVNPDGTLQIDGNPVFPIGLTMAPPPDGQSPDGDPAFEELSKAGINFMRSGPVGGNWTPDYLKEEKHLLDVAAKYSMQAAPWLKELADFPAGATVKEERLKELVNALKDHPGLGVWKGADEPEWGKIPVANCKRVYDVIKSLDPNHPIWVVQAPRGTVQSLAAYDSTYDITGTDVYPVSYPPGGHSLLPNKEISMVGDYAQRMRQVTQGKKPFWMTLQIAWSGVAGKGKTLRFPTFAQERFMTYQAIINGARGLIYFGGNLPQTFNEQDAKLGWNWSFWQHVLKPLVEEVGAHGPLAQAMLAPDANLPVRVNGQGIEFVVRETPEALFILACDRDPVNTAQIKFTGLPSSAGEGKVLFEEPRTVKATNGSFEDWFGPFEVHVYRFAR
jgi:hypothetical protein